jgi:hypothetical protein
VTNPDDDFVYLDAERVSTLVPVPPEQKPGPVRYADLTAFYCRSWGGAIHLHHVVLPALRASGRIDPEAGRGDEPTLDGKPLRPSQTVRFATLCCCGARSEEYTAWPTCRGCQEFICPSCAAPGSLVTGDGDGPDTVLCRGCR